MYKPLDALAAVTVTEQVVNVLSPAGHRPVVYAQAIAVGRQQFPFLREIENGKKRDGTCEIWTNKRNLANDA